MIAGEILRLAARTVTEPRPVARALLGLHLPREALLTGFALAVVVNTLLHGIAQLAAPPGAVVLLPLPLVAFAALQAAALGGTMLAFWQTGRGLGGRARLADIAVLILWLQVLRLILQLGLIPIAALAPVLGGPLLLGATMLGVWIAVAFLDEAHGLGNPFRAFVVLILGVLGMAVALSVLLTLAGLNSEGALTHV